MSAECNPQLEDGFMRVANELFEAMIVRFPFRVPGPFLIFLAVMRETYGFGRKSAKISTDRFRCLTGIAHRNNVYRAIKQAIAVNLINAIRNDGEKYPTYSIQKNYSKWTCAIKNDCAIRNDGGSNQKRWRAQSEMMAVCKLKTPSKETPKETSLCPIPENFVLNNGLKAYAIKKGIPERDVQNWFDSFCAKAKAEGMICQDWTQRWFQFITNVALNPKNKSPETERERWMRERGLLQS